MDGPSAAASTRSPSGLGVRALVGAVPLVALCLLPVLLYLPFLSAPFERDEGVYATIAQGILEGKVPYRDLFDNKPPLIFGWYAFSFLLFGEEVFAPRLVAAVLLSCATLCVFFQARLLFSRGAAYVAAGVFAASTGLALVSLNANTEVYMLLPLVASLVAVTVGVRSGHLRWFLLSGALAGLAMMTKQVAVWNLVSLVGIAAVWQWRGVEPLWRRLVPAALLVAGAAAAVAAVAAPFAATGALDDFVYANITYNWLYVGVPSWEERLLNLANGAGFFLLVAAPLVAGALAGAFVLVRRQQWPVDHMLLVWTLASAVGVASGGRYFPHYFVHLLPAMAILTAAAVHEWSGEIRTGLVARPALALAVVLLAVSLSANAVLYVAPSEAKRRVADNWYEQARWEADSDELAAYLAARTAPEDIIYNYGRETQVYFYADRRPAARYMYERPFWWNERTLYETMETLRQVKPVYIVDSAHQPLFDDYDRYHPPVFKRFLAENYDYVGRLYFADVYRLKQPSP